MQNTLLRRNPFTLPAIDKIDACLLRKVIELSRELDTLAPVSSVVVGQSPDSFFSPLLHPLSGAYIELNGRVEIPVRSEIERDALNWLEDQPTLLETLDHSSFLSMLETLNRRLTDSLGGWRAGNISTAKDMRGNSILFPPVSRVKYQMEQLKRLLDTGTGEAPAIFTATMTLACLTNCHPFKDGNGRVARVLFNYVLRKGGMRQDVYVAFSELAARSEGAYLIALRQGELRGQWEPLLQFVMKMLDVHQVLAHLNEASSDDS